MFYLYSIRQVAKVRRYPYAVLLDDKEDRVGSMVLVAGFANEKNVDVKRDFGGHYREADQAIKDRVFAGSDFDFLFNDGPRPIASPHP